MSPAGPLSAVRDAQRFYKVPSLIFDLEVEDSRAAEAVADSAGDPCNITERVATLMRPRTVAEFRLRSDVEALVKAGHLETSQLAPALGSLGYTCVIRTGLGGDCGVKCVKNLRHAFLICTPTGSLARQGNHFLVDPEFRDNFHIANPTPRYSALLAAVPAVFVGSHECLACVVSLLCFEMRVAFAATGATLPPWRQASSMLSKWQPRRSVDMLVSEDGAVVPVTTMLGWAPPPLPAAATSGAGWQSPMLQAFSAAGWGSPFGAASESQLGTESSSEGWSVPPLPPAPAAKTSPIAPAFDGAFGAKVWTATAGDLSSAAAAADLSAAPPAEWCSWAPLKPDDLKSVPAAGGCGNSQRLPSALSSRRRSSLSLQLSAMRDFISMSGGSGVAPMVA